MTDSKNIRIASNKEFLKKLEYDEVKNLRLDMVHASISVNDRYIALGTQESYHLI